MKYKTTTKSLVLSFALMYSGIVYAQGAPDFTSDIEKGVLSQNNLAAQIKSQDFQSSWDEFGTNILVDGSIGSSADITASLVHDIANDLQMQLVYDQADEQYLKVRNSSPEEVIKIETEDGNDLLPENYVEPHPSLDANPDVNPSTLDMSPSEIETPPTPSPSEVVPIIEDIPVVSPDSLLPSNGQWAPSDVSVFETILGTEKQSAEAATGQATSTEPDHPKSVDIAPPSEAPQEPQQPEFVPPVEQPSI